MIQNLIKSGFDLEDIQALHFLFQKNISSYETIFAQGNTSLILSTIHKLKGSLKILQHTELLESLEPLEMNIKLEGTKVYRSQLATIIEECRLFSCSILTELEALVSDKSI